jgi:DNA-binding NtrC family response regulator
MLGRAGAESAAFPFTKAGPPPRDRNGFARWLEGYFLGRHPLIRKARAAIVRAAAEDWPVLITGETGTGKEMAFWAVHDGGVRSVYPPHVVHVGGLGETAWSTLFGHRKGAFTGAVYDLDGVFLAANGSSVILDDVVTLPQKIQPMLLRAIEQGCFRPLGESREVKADVRVIATTNVPLEEEVAHGRFRHDLYERLAVLKVSLPPLRAHLEDLEIYVPHFLQAAARPGRPPKKISEEAMDFLRGQTWPGNVRELKHLLFRASVDVEGTTIEMGTLQSLVNPGISRTRPGRNGSLDGDAVREALKSARGNKREAARLLKVAPNTLYKLMREHGIES